MGYDFYAGHGRECLNDSGWSWCFDFAIKYGWQPAGTAPPNDYDGVWCKSYFSNDFQKVDDSDARALGEALLRGIPIEEARERDNPSRWPDDRLRRLREFAVFAMKGGFVIG
jgi:hypothetical protein